MQETPNGALRARDGEVLTLNITSTGAETLFGVTYALGGTGTPIPQGSPFAITLKKSDATGGSDIPGAKSIVLTLAFHFTSPRGGQYHYTMVGDPGGAQITGDPVQAGSLPTVDNFVIHIL